ncbi:hypothetical protein FB565_000464 [Actinoplanes lutulentus]|nr:hypothetical protein [Actinoplanes lutulentus]
METPARVGFRRGPNRKSTRTQAAPSQGSASRSGDPLSVGISVAGLRLAAPNRSGGTLWPGLSVSELRLARRPAFRDKSCEVSPPRQPQPHKIARKAACPPARLPACPPARLPACPPARLPACPPADLVRFRRPGNHKLTRSRGRPAAPPARLPARLPDCPAAVLVRFRRPGNHKLTRSRGRPTAPPAHLPTCESCAVSPQRQPQAHKIARKADGTTCPPAHVRILCGFAATATATSLDRAEGRRHRLAGWLAGDLVRFRRGGSHKLTRSVWRGRAVRCPGGGGAVFVGRAGRCGAGGGAVFVRRAVLGLREACGVCAGSCGGGLVRRGVIGGGRDHLLRSLGAGSVASPRRALGGSGGLYPPPRCDLKLILRGF